MRWLRRNPFLPATALLFAVSSAAVPALAEFQEPAAESPPFRANLLVITLDTTRADHLGVYGWRFARTPHLDRLAARGVRFERADTAAPVTLPSHASIFTGLYPPRHGVRDNGTFHLGGERHTVAEQLRAAGYDTAAVVGAVVLARRYGLDQGFAVYDDAMEAHGAGLLAEERDAEAVTEAALAQLAGLEAPWFLWVHYYDPHVEYRPPERLLAGQSGPYRAYDAEIAFADEQIGRLLEAVPAGTVVAAVGDHGEMLGEHGEAAHGVLLHRGSRRVPLILAGGGLPAGEVISELVRTVDLAPTLLELAGAPPLPEDGGVAIDGESLLPLLATGGESARTISSRTFSRISYSESFLPLYAYRWYPLRALSDGRWLYVDAPRPRLFDLAADPAEGAEAAAEPPRYKEQSQRWAAELARRLEVWGEKGERLPEPEPLAAEQRRALEALGYVGGGGRPQSLADLPDPYDVVDIAARLHELAPRVQRQECGGETLGELRRILRRNRDNLPALNMAGICRMGEGEYEAALPYFRHAVEVHPRSTIARANLAGCLLRLERREEAEAAYRETLALDPTVPQAVANLARLLREAGRPEEAMAVLEAGFAAGGSQVPWFLERGLLHAEARRLPQALADFERVLQAEPANPVALDNVARAAYLLGDARRAAALYTRLVELEPRRLEAWKTLGAIQLYELGELGGARASFARALVLETDPAERRELEEILAELRE